MFQKLLKIIRTYQKIDLKKWQFLYCFRKTPSKLAFFSRKMVKYDLKIFKTFLRNCKSYQVKQVFKKPAFPWLLTSPWAYPPSPPPRSVCFFPTVPPPSLTPFVYEQWWWVNTKQPLNSVTKLIGSLSYLNT